jgi:hypothetical protein
MVNKIRKLVLSISWFIERHTDHIFCVRQILEKKWEYNEAVHQVFVDFKKAYHVVRMGVLYNILTDFCTPLKLVRLIKMCLNKTYSSVRVDRHF